MRSGPPVLSSSTTAEAVLSITAVAAAASKVRQSTDGDRWCVDDIDAVAAAVDQNNGENHKHGSSVI